MLRLEGAEATLLTPEFGGGSVNKQCECNLKRRCFCILLTSHTSCAASRLLVQQLEHNKHMYVCNTKIENDRKQNCDTASDKEATSLDAKKASSLLAVTGHPQRLNIRKASPKMRPEKTHAGWQLVLGRY